MTEDSSSETRSAGPEVLAVIATLGQSPVLDESLASLERERAGVDLRSVVVLQGRRVQGQNLQGDGDQSEGADDATSLVTKLGALADHLEQVKEPRGFANANNLGRRAGVARFGSPRWLLLMNDDAVLGEGWLKAMIETLETHADVAAVQALNLLPAEAPADAAARYLPEARVDGAGIGWNHRLQAIQVGHGRPASTERHTSDEPREVFGASATAVLLRAAAVDAVGDEMFDPALGTYYEDVDLACRLRAAGWRALSRRDVSCRHHASSSAPSHRRRLLVANRHLVLARALGRAYPVRVPLLLWRDVVDFGPRACGGWLRALLRLPGFLHLGAPLPLDPHHPFDGPVP